jgi:hypothetical protein
MTMSFWLARQVENTRQAIWCQRNVLEHRERILANFVEGVYNEPVFDPSRLWPIPSTISTTRGACSPLEETMVQLTLHCKDKRSQHREWLLVLADDGARLTDSAGTLRAWIPSAQAYTQFYLPDSRGQNNLGILLDTQVIVWFEADTETVAQVADHMHGVWAAKAEESFRALRRTGWQFMGWGTLTFLLAIALPVASVMSLANDSGSGMFVFSIGLFSLGGWIYSQGYSKLVKASYGLKKLKRG